MVSFSSEKKEECGIIAIYSKNGEDVAPYIYRALVALQHRGQDAAGMVVLGPQQPASGSRPSARSAGGLGASAPWQAVSGSGSGVLGFGGTEGRVQNPEQETPNPGLEAGGGKLVARRGLGLVSDIFTKEDMLLKGRLGIGHTRYPTTGRCLMEDIQPSVIDGISVTHNGHIANYDAVRSSLESEGYAFTGTVDSEPIAYLLHSQLKQGRSVEDAVRHVMGTLDGAYSDAAIINGRLAVFRDPHAIRPLVWGENDRFVSFASESCALDVNGIPFKGSVDGGELVILASPMERKSLMKKEPRHCMFEYVYFSRPDSVINGKEVLEVRKRLGTLLAREHPADADVVVPVPDTSRTAAEAYARAQSIPLEEGLIKNRYIGRTFIMPRQEERSGNVRLKLNPVRSLVAGKRVVLIDDSIVRGTTLKEIISLVRGAGASEVHVRITCPPIRAPCFYGVDMKSYRELVASDKQEDEVARFLGVDSLGYLSLAGLREAIGQPICTGCLNGDYVTPVARRLAAERKSAC
ncbi:MAG: amidophosphoribosyltransferase [Candidatus Micrarchaeota archaeon]